MYMCICVYIYVFMYVCMYVCVYVCMYMCVYIYVYSGTSIIRTSIIRMLGLSERQIRRACAKIQWLSAAF